MTTDEHPVSPTSAERGQLLSLIRSISLERGRFVLSSGAVSDHYLDLRKTTTHPAGAFLAARFLAHEAQRLGATHVGGPTLGADPIVGATVALSHESTWPLRGYLVRSAAKDHGTGRQVEGQIEAGARVIILDDVVTSAGSLLKAVDAVRSLEAEIVGAWCLVDRAAGGRESLARAGLDLTAVFHIDEVLAEAVTHLPALHGFRPRTPLVTVDGILELVPGHVLLVRRRHEPLGWALPGGFVEPGETLEQALRREIEEETGLRVERAVQMHAYSGPERDPRFETVSTVFVAVAHGEVAAGDDAANARLFPLDALPELAFDHRQILDDFRTGRHGLEPGHLH